MRQCVRVRIPSSLPLSVRLILRVCSLGDGSDAAAHRLSEVSQSGSYTVGH